jgi:peroxiredoxin
VPVRVPFLHLLFIAAAAGSASALAQEPGPAALDAVAAIRARETALPRARLQLEITERRGPFKEGEILADTQKRISGEPPLSARGTLLFAPDGWIKDLAVPTARSNVSSTRTRTGASGDLFRVLMQATVDGREQSRGWVLRVSTVTPADAVLGRRVAASLDGIEWTAARVDGELLRLEGRRGKEQHSLALTRQPVTAVRSWTLAREVEGPSGEKIRQSYVCEAVSAPDGSPTQVQEWVLNPPPAANVAHRLTIVKETQPLTEVKPEELLVRFPKGTVVEDRRAEAPVEYEVADEGLDEEAVAGAVRALAQGRTRAGQPAPDFELKDLKGAVVRQQDLLGRPLVLVWFSSRAEASGAAAPAVQKLFSDFRRRNVRFLGIAVAEEGDARQKAEAFGKKHRWSFPIVLDEVGETLRRYGTVSAVPKAAVVDPRGTITYVEPGFDDAAVRAALTRLLTVRN